MAIKFANTINSGLAYNLGGSVNRSIGFFSGTQPTAAHITTNYTTGDNIRNNYLGGLVYLGGSVGTQYNGTRFAADNSYTLLTGSNPTFVAAATGTCTYAILTNQSTAFSFTTATDATMTSARFAVIPVTDSLTAGGIIRLNTVSFTSGGTITITDYTFYASGGEA